MQMPTPGPEHKQYELMAGTFRGDETLHPMPWDPNTTKVTSKTVNRIALDGFFLIVDHEQTRDGKISYRGHGVYGYDRERAGYTMYWFDVMGFDPVTAALGTWKDDTLQFEHAHHRGHSRYTYRFVSEGQYTLKIEMSQDGKQWSTFLTGTYTRI